MPDCISKWSIVSRHAIRKSGRPQRFSTAILAKGTPVEDIRLSSKHGWVSDELGLATQPAFSADMRQQQAAMAEEPTEMPAVQVHGPSEEIPQRTVPSNRAHVYPYPPINAVQLSASGMQIS
jgi:hypothetical protein